MTNNCTRKCSFCDIEQDGYFASKEDIDKFYDYVISFEKINKSNYEISLYGGEPLLNFENLIYIIDKFYNEKCKINLVTNGDLITKFFEYDYNKYLKRIHTQITVYDIFEDYQKYENYINLLRDKTELNIAYTFTENDIDKVFDFINISNKLNILYKIAFSHNPESWENISEQDLENKLRNIYKYEVKQNNSILMLKYVGRVIENIYNKNIKEYYCIDNKKTFYHGKFIGPCFQCLNHNLFKLKYDLIGCNNCKYKNICSKSCIAKYKNNIVNNKLCLIEKVAFDVIYEILDKDVKY